MTISSEGDIGDVVYLLGILKSLPNGPHTLLCEASKSTKTGADPQRLVSLIGPLAEQQPYIKECRVARPDDVIDWRSAEFRKLKHYTPGETLMQAHLNHYNKVSRQRLVVKGDTPWLTVKPSPLSKGRIVVNRTGRYRNSRFPWGKVVDHYKHLLLFVGLHHEWREVCGHFGYMDYAPTSNMLEVAEIIAGSELFIGNQSCSNAIAEGLKHPRIQETDLTFPDCIFPTVDGYAKGQHVANGAVVLPAVGSRPSVTFAPEPFKAKPVECSVVPPGMWQYPGCIRSTHLINVARELSKKEQITVDQATQMVYDFQRDRLPDFFRDPSEEAGFSRVQKALKRIQ
jgi:hypothetical protein